MTIYDVFVPPDDFSVVVVEDTSYTDHFAEVTLVDENGNTLVDENGNTLVVTEVTAGNVYVVYATPDDFSVIVPEE